MYVNIDINGKRSISTIDGTAEEICRALEQAATTHTNLREALSILKGNATPVTVKKSSMLGWSPRISIYEHSIHISKKTVLHLGQHNDEFHLEFAFSADGVFTRVCQPHADSYAFTSNVTSRDSTEWRLNNAAVIRWFRSFFALPGTKPITLLLGEPNENGFYPLILKENGHK